MDSDRKISPAVINRLPRYYRYLGDLLESDITRISSKELSERMNVTASQIRQDLNCFGGFGQQGYGYNVNYLYSKICEILGVGFGFRAAFVGAGNLGTALARSPMFEKRGVDVVAMFDVSADLIGKKVSEINIYSLDCLEQKLNEFGKEKMAELCGVGLPTVQDIVKELQKPGRDPRDELVKPMLRSDVMDMNDLKEGMILDGTVRNVIDFGVFVDIGVHQDGLVHISQICSKFIKHPSEVLSVGDIVKVWVDSVDLQRKRLALTMIMPEVQ